MNLKIEIDHSIKRGGNHLSRENTITTKTFLEVKSVMLLYHVEKPTKNRQIYRLQVVGAVKLLSMDNLLMLAATPSWSLNGRFYLPGP